MIVSGFFQNFVSGPLRAPGQITAWNRNQVDPSGYRQWESGLYRPAAKIGLVGGFPAQMESGRALDFGEATVVDGLFLSDTVVLTFNLGEVNSHPDSYFNNMVAASSVGIDFKAYNMKFWVGNLSAFSGSGLPTPIFHMRTSADWIRGLQISPGGPAVLIVPSAIPISGNVMAKAPPTVFISGVYSDLEYSHYIYLVAEFPSGQYNLGTYGGLGSDNFKFRFSYDYTGINANVLPSDLELCVHSGV